MNRICIEFRGVAMGVILYVIDGSTATFIGTMNDVIETYLSIRVSSSYRSTVYMAIFTIGAESIIDSEAILAIDIMAFLFNLMTLLISLELIVLSLRSVSEDARIVLEVGSIHSVRAIVVIVKEKCYHLDSPLFFLSPLSIQKEQPS